MQLSKLRNKRGFNFLDLELVNVLLLLLPLPANANVFPAVVSLPRKVQSMGRETKTSGPPRGILGTYFVSNRSLRVFQIKLLALVKRRRLAVRRHSLI